MHQFIWGLSLSGLICLLAACASLPPSVRREEMIYQTLDVTDALQTMRIADEPKRHIEMNPILGRHPAPHSAAVYFAVTSAAHLGVTAWLNAVAPRWVVDAWEASGMGLEAVCVGHNFRRGLVPTLSFEVKH